VWWHTPVISTLGRLRQDDLEFEANMDYKMALSLKEKKKNSMPKLQMELGKKEVFFFSANMNSRKTPDE
jgi:hypothetical protein